MAKVDEYKDALEDMVWQFAYKSVINGVPHLHAGGLSALEGAFTSLEWPNPKPCPEGKCDMVGCNEWATCGTNTPKTYTKQYYNCCGKHWSQIQRELDEENRNGFRKS